MREISILALIFLVFACDRPVTKPPANKAPMFPKVDGKNVMAGVKTQIDFGPRITGSKAAEQTSMWIAENARKVGMVTFFDDFTDKSGRKFRNILVTHNGSSSDFIVVASHYDTKKIEEFPKFTGANDGASSTALVVELMKLVAGMKEFDKGYSIQFVFFDGEECLHKYNKNDGLHGSKHYVKNLNTQSKNQCRAMILADMIGDKNLDVILPANSSGWLSREVLAVAEKQGVKKFFTMSERTILDDHVPFIKRGIPAVDIIDFNFGPKNSFWHTEEDTLDKISAESLEIVGNLMLELIWNISRIEKK